MIFAYNGILCQHTFCSLHGGLFYAPTLAWITYHLDMKSLVESTRRCQVSRRK